MDKNQLSAFCEAVLSAIKNMPDPQPIYVEQDPIGAMRVGQARKELYGGISETKLREWANKGKIPAFKFDNTWFFPVAETQKWFEKKLGKFKLDEKMREQDLRLLLGGKSRSRKGA